MKKLALSLLFCIGCNTSSPAPVAVENVTPPAQPTSPSITFAPKQTESNSCSSLVDCQQYLASHGYTNVVADGKFGPQTFNAWFECYNSRNCFPRMMPGSNSEGLDCQAAYWQVIKDPFINPTNSSQVCSGLYRPGTDTSYLMCSTPDAIESGCFVYINNITLTMSQLCCPPKKNVGQGI